MAVMASYKPYAHSPCCVRAWDLSSQALYPPGSSTGFRITREAIGMLLSNLESSFRCSLPWQQDQSLVTSFRIEANFLATRLWESQGIHFKNLTAGRLGLRVGVGQGLGTGSWAGRL